jgi:hypothetical protein
MTLAERYTQLLRKTTMSEWELRKYQKDFSALDKQHYQEINGETINNKWANQHQYLEEHFILLRETAKLGRFPNKSSEIDYLIKAFPLASVSAKVTKYPEGNLILMHDGLIVFSSIYLSILLRSKEFQGRLPNNLREAALYDSEMESEMMATLFYEYLFSRILAPNTTPVLFKDRVTTLDANLWPILLNIQHEMIAFVFAHELGHIQLGHLNKPPHEIETVDIGNMQFEVFGWPDEFDADIFASTLLFNPNRKRIVNDKPLKDHTNIPLICTYILAGIFVFFHIVRALEFYTEKANTFFGNILPLSHIHPPAIQRMEMVLDSLKAKGVIPHYPNGIGIAKPFIEHYYNKEPAIWEKIKAKIIAQRK